MMMMPQEKPGAITIVPERDMKLHSTVAEASRTTNVYPMVPQDKKQLCVHQVDIDMFHWINKINHFCII